MPAIMDARQALDFERPIVELENKIEELKQLGGPSLDFEIRRLERKARQLQQEVFSELSAWQKVMLSRHPLRPFTLDYVGRLIDGFVELHGDRAFREDAAIVGGLGRWRAAGFSRPVMVIGHQKGRGTKENIKRNFGQPRPEGFRKARRLMELAARLGLPILTFIDTVGAYPGIEAEERGQAEAIAKNLEVMARLPVPIVSIVIGEGGSGGALALGVADRVLMLEYAVYSVISPEGCASILWKDQKKVDVAARELKMTAADMADLGVADRVIDEPPGGAHRDPESAARAVSEAVTDALIELSGLSVAARLQARYNKFRRMGSFLDAKG
jgi:acetyl-CoA carboxylase carboxyl transferase subunit alpha